MPDLSESVRLSRLFSALSDPLRRKVLVTMIRQPGLTVSDLGARFPVSRFVIMRHLNVLEQAGLVIRERAGKEKRLIAHSDEMRGLIEKWQTTITPKGNGHDQS